MRLQDFFLCEEGLFWEVKFRMRSRTLIEFGEGGAQVRVVNLKAGGASVSDEEEHLK